MNLQRRSEVENETTGHSYAIDIGIYIQLLGTPLLEMHFLIP